MYHAHLPSHGKPVPVALKALDLVQSLRGHVAPPAGRTAYHRDILDHDEVLPSAVCPRYSADAGVRAAADVTPHDVGTCLSLHRSCFPCLRPTWEPIPVRRKTGALARSFLAKNLGTASKGERLPPLRDHWVR